VSTIVTDELAHPEGAWGRDETLPGSARRMSAVQLEAEATA